MNNQRPFLINRNICATSGQRFAHYVIDSISIYIIMFLFSFVVTHISIAFNYYGFVEWTQNSSDLEGQLLFFMFMLIYFIVFETFTSRSLAKFITGTIVVMEDGSKPDFVTIVSRTLFRFIPYDVISFFSINVRGWHDSISNTFVVYKNRLETMKRLHDELDETGANKET